jgi:hypothetical protein
LYVEKNKIKIKINKNAPPHLCTLAEGGYTGTLRLTFTGEPC